MTLPTIPRDLTPATAEEISSALKALFSQFPSHDSGDPRFRVLGYQDALSGEPLWAVEQAVRRFLRGQVSSHDGRFLPTSAELARVVREESDMARRMVEREAPRPMLTDQRVTEISEEKREANYQRLKSLAETIQQSRYGALRMLGGASETRDDRLAAAELGPIAAEPSEELLNNRLTRKDYGQ